MLKSNFTWWTVIVAVASVIAFTPSVQGRRVRHAPWLGGALGRCTSCPPGWGVERRCSRGPLGVLRDTACSPCRHGQRFAPHHSARAPCLLCSRCGQGLYVARACTATSDTRCAACLPAQLAPPAARRNRDYLDKCVAAVAADIDAMQADAPAAPAAPAALATFGLSQPAAATRSKTDMARSILADPGEPRRAQGSRLPHAVFADAEPATARGGHGAEQHNQYALEPGSKAGPTYSVLTDDGPVRMAPAPATPRHAAPRHRAPPPRPHPAAVRLSSPITWGSPSAPSVNTRQEDITTQRTSGLGPIADLQLHQHADDAGDMNAEEVGRLML